VHDDELLAAIREVRERARARTPNGNLGLEGVAAPDLMPLLYARDAAEAKVAAIGTVNPRPSGLKNSIVQSVKHLIARALDWHVREQVEFNRATMGCVQKTLEALTDASRSLAALATHQRQLREDWDSRERQLREQFLDSLQSIQRRLESTQRDTAELGSQMTDIRRHWAEWRPGFEERRSASEIHILRTISELQAAFQHRVTLLEQNYREMVRHQHEEFTSALERNAVEVQQRLWKDLENVRAEYEKLIYNELRLLRQKPSIAAENARPAEAPAHDRIPIDWVRFADAFRGPEQNVRDRQRKYVAHFQNAGGEILDIGCGRGEFLEAARDAGLSARGIDFSTECVARCQAKGLTAEAAEAFAYLRSLPDGSLRGAFCAQMIEHLPPSRLPELIQLVASKLHPGSLAVFETPNPECLATFSTHFYLDPTHTRPVPPALLGFYLEEAGFGQLRIERLEPATGSIPALAELPPAVREVLFDGLDYAIVARKL
jgi:O-antigen chain-terminating methyltransferase